MGFIYFDDAVVQCARADANNLSWTNIYIIANHFNPQNAPTIKGFGCHCVSCFYFFSFFRYICVSSKFVKFVALICFCKRL